LAASYQYETAIEFLEKSGIDREQLLEGSIPEDSLKEVIRLHSELGLTPARLLHIGNFVGVSLAYLTHHLLRLHSGSFVVSIDPNIPHRGVQRPMDACLSLLDHFGLTQNTAIITGFTLEANLGDDGIDYSGNQGTRDIRSNAASCENQLPLLGAICPHAFTSVVIDGNHQSDYVRREIQCIEKLVRPGGIVVFDDVSEHWENLRAVFAEVTRGSFREILSDGRIGVAVRVQ